jgi:uncharacterized protein YkwD
MTLVSKREAYLLRLINESREDAGLRPLRFDTDLNQAAEWHSAWMLRTDTFSHEGSGGSRVADRVQDAGYELSGSWAVGENIALRQIDSDPGLWDDVRAVHRTLMNSPSHRENLLSARYDEVGIGIVVGEYRGVEVLMVTQDFARTSADDVSVSRMVNDGADDFDFAASSKSSPANEPGLPLSAQLAPLSLWLDAPWSDLL